MEKIVTYSPAYTLVPTYECFNRCTYCNFRRNPGEDEWMSVESARTMLQAIADSLATEKVIEILVLSGEVHPQSKRRPAWFKRIYQICELALEMGFLPHTNAGPLSYEEMAKLRDVNVSMGLMVEQVTPALLETVHKHAPSKVPAVRLQQLELAGQLKIPFTTGLLLGLGETQSDWTTALAAIARIHAKYHHIQEVILQPHQPGQTQAEARPACHGRTLLQAVKLARSVLPSDIKIQIPPNLILSNAFLLACIEAGASDLGGVVPLDEVNPDYGHRSLAAMTALLAEHGRSLKPRLPVHIQFDAWLKGNVAAATRHWRNTLQKKSTSH